MTCLIRCATIPEEIKQARWIVKERQEMLQEAKAERILTEGREKRRRGWPGEQEVVKRAQRQAEDIIREAEAREREIRLGAEDYADEILRTLETNLDKFLGCKAARSGATTDRAAGRGRLGSLRGVPLLSTITVYLSLHDLARTGSATNGRILWNCPLSFREACLIKS